MAASVVSQKHALDQALAQIRQNFTLADKYLAHERSQPIAREIGTGTDYIFEIVTRNLLVPGFFEQTRINPVLRLVIADEAGFSFMFHGWMPLPNRDTDTTHQSIHHHGNLLLSTYSAFGPGYESIVFEKGYTINPDTRETDMKVSKMYKNKLGMMEFIDADTPHVVFYPPQFSVTLPLWSMNSERKIDTLKKIPFLNSIKKPIANALRTIGLSKSLGLNAVESLDFYPQNGRVYSLKERVMYGKGTQANHVQNIFHMLQLLGYRNEAVIHSATANLPPETEKIVRPWANAFLNNQTIADAFEPEHLNVQHVNFSRKELQKCFPQIRDRFE
jgi:hypothetical protein